MVSVTIIPLATTLFINSKRLDHKPATDCRFSTCSASWARSTGVNWGLSVAKAGEARAMHNATPPAAACGR